jgi:acyl-coenzyme A thioesterase PaaI-like protein
LTGDTEADRSADLHADERAHFMATMGFDCRIEGDLGLGQVSIGSYLRSAPQWPSTAALLTFADVVIGVLASHQTAPRISVTSNLAVHIVGPLPSDGALSMRGRLSKVGRSMTVGETEMRASESGDLVATAIGTFLASPRPQDVARITHARFGPMPGAQPNADTLAGHVGLRVIEPGLTEIGLRSDLTNATESLQGGLVALLGETAAQTAASSTAGAPAVVESLDVYYLAAAWVGPFRAAARLLRDDLFRVEIRDPGRDDRMVAIATARTCPAG